MSIIIILKWCLYKYRKEVILGLDVKYIIIIIIYVLSYLFEKKMCKKKRHFDDIYTSKHNKLFLILNKMFYSSSIFAFVLKILKILGYQPDVN